MQTWHRFLGTPSFLRCWCADPMFWPDGLIWCADAQIMDFCETGYNNVIIADQDHFIALCSCCWNPTIVNCMAKTWMKTRKDKIVPRREIFNCQVLMPRLPPAATLAGIIRQYFCGSGNEVGTGSGCCQDGRAPPHPTTSPARTPFSLFHASLSPINLTPSFKLYLSHTTLSSVLVRICVCH